MKINVKNQDNKTIIFISGNIDIPASEELKKLFTDIVDTGVKEVEVDFTGVEFIGSSGLGKLLMFYKNLSSKGGTVKIVNMNEDIKVLFKAIKLDKIFGI